MKYIWMSWEKGERSSLSLVSTYKLSPVPEGKPEKYEYSLSGKIMKLLRLGIKKGVFYEWDRELDLSTSVPPISVPKPYLRNMATHSWHASSFLLHPSHPPHPLTRLILTIWTYFTPGASWHTQHLLCTYFYNKWLMSKQNRTYPSTNTTSQWHSQLKLKRSEVLENTTEAVRREGRRFLL